MMDANITEWLDIIYNGTSVNDTVLASTTTAAFIGIDTTTTAMASTIGYGVTSTVVDLTRSSRNSTANATQTWVTWFLSGRVQIPLYSIILLLAVIGNGLVILTLVQNRRMRTITNLFLLNLAVSDILLGVLCMPFTLIGSLLRDFVFGEIMCMVLPYFQGKCIGIWPVIACKGFTDEASRRWCDITEFILADFVHSP